MRNKRQNEADCTNSIFILSKPFHYKDSILHQSGAVHFDIFKYQIQYSSISVSAAELPTQHRPSQPGKL